MVFELFLVMSQVTYMFTIKELLKLTANGILLFVKDYVYTVLGIT